MDEFQKRVYASYKRVCKHPKTFEKFINNEFLNKDLMKDILSFGDFKKYLKVIK